MSLLEPGLRIQTTMSKEVRLLVGLAALAVLVGISIVGSRCGGRETEDLEPEPDPILGLVVAPERVPTCPDTGSNKRPSTFRPSAVADLRREFPAADGWQIDHRVAWMEAMDSGLCDRPRSVILDFYSDRDNLEPMKDWENNSKGDKDYAEWRPSVGQCAYLREYLATKRKWNLTADRVEAAALRRDHAVCYSTPAIR